MSVAWSYQAPATLSAEQLQRWAALVERRTGIDLSQHPSILSAGINRRLREIERADTEAYFEQVSDWPGGVAEWMALVDCIAIQETSFFRQREAFDLVYRFLLQRLNRRRQQQPVTLDLWSLGCASGEEAYALAMVALLARERSDAVSYSGVLATDISGRALRQARTGLFSSRRVSAIPAPLQRAHWQPGTGDQWQCLPALKEQVCFVQGNALELDRTPMVPMDVIFCQNVLIYFRRWRRRKVLDALVNRLKPGGLLVVGAGEAAQWHNPQVTRLRHPSVQAYVRRHKQRDNKGAMDG